MSVYGHTRKPPPHTGVVVFSFVDDKGNTVYGNRVYTKNDAALVYDAVRAKYPEHDELRLVVTVKDQPTHDEQRGVVVRGLDRVPAACPPGEPFTERLDWLGPRPKIKAPGRLLEAVGEGPAPEELGRLLSAFANAGVEWREAKVRPWE